MRLNILCAGAAQGLVDTLRPRFLAETGSQVRGQFGAVGAMRERLEAGDPCDVLVTSRVILDALLGSGDLWPDAQGNLGRVHTSVAVVDAAEPPDVSTPGALKKSLREAREIFLPDPQRSTAGIHFASVLDKLGVQEQPGRRYRVFPNGRTAMAALAEANDPTFIGCTQSTEIKATANVRLVGPLPDPLGLVTVYSAGVTRGTTQPDLARRLVSLLVGEDLSDLRQECGFDVAAPGCYC